MGKWHISKTDDSGFYGDCESREEAIALGIAEGYDIFYVGEDRPPKPLSKGVFAEEVIEQAQDCLEEDWCLEFAHFEPTKEHHEALQELLRQAVDKWFEQYPELKPKWFLIDDVERIEVDKHGEVIR